MAGWIVCGVDGSSGSRRAASVAARLARELASRALLVNVVERSGLRYRLRLPRLGPAREMRRVLTTMLEEHCFPDGTEIRLEAGPPAEQLMAVAEREDAELVVVGTLGLRRARGALLGSVSSALMERAPCPVVVVPAAVASLDAAGMRSVVCGVAGEEGDVSVLRLAADLARRLGAQVHAVHAYEPGALPARAPGPQRKLNDVLEKAGVEARGIVLPLRAPEALDRVAREEHAGLVVVRSRGARMRGSVVLHGAVPTRLAAEGSTALVVLPPAARLEAGSGHYEFAASAA